MTNFEFIKTLKTAEEFMNFYEAHNCGCLQYGVNAKQIWHDICLSDKFRGKDGCRKCKLNNFWNSEVDFNAERIPN